MTTTLTDRRQFVVRSVQTVLGMTTGLVTSFDADAHQGLHRIAVRVKGWS